MAEMLPTTQILENISKNSKCNKDEVFTRIYRYMLRPDLYYVAYKNLYANSGAATQGVNSDTALDFLKRKSKALLGHLQTKVTCQILPDGHILKSPMAKCARWEYRPLRTNLCRKSCEWY